jgi:sugar phosphate isomerase/epimerase
MITLSTGTIYYHGLERIFEIAKAAGYSGLELMLASPEDRGFLDTWDIDYLKSLEDKYTLKIQTVHNYMNFEQEPQDFPKILQLTEDLQAKFLIVHIPRQNQDAYKEWFDQFIEKGSQANISIENMGRKALIKDIDEWKKFQNFCFDITHSLKADEDPAMLLRELPNLREIHVSDYRENTTHMSILENEKKFDAILFKDPEIIKCVELVPKNICTGSKTELIDLLAKHREYLEKFD